MKKFIITLLISLFTTAIYAQTNVQEMYDFNREQLTTTFEHFNSDKYGNNFFFIDVYHPLHENTTTDFYFEASRSLNFWHDSGLKDVSLHLEFNGGCGIFNLGNNNYGGYKVNNAYLIGADYFIHSKDFSKTLTLSLLYKKIDGKDSKVPLQFTTVWGINNLFKVKGLNFSGFADFWFEDNYFGNDKTTCTFLSEPQVWYTLNKNLKIGGEVEVSYNFIGNKNKKKGWEANPAIGVRWDF